VPASTILNPKLELLFPIQHSRSCDAVPIFARTINSLAAKSPTITIRAMVDVSLLSLFALVKPETDGAGTAAIYFVPACLLAVAIFGFGVSKEREGGKAWVKFVSLPVVLISAIICRPYYQFANDPFNKNIGAIGGRSELAYNLSFWMPTGLFILLLVGGILAQRWLNNESSL